MLGYSAIMFLCGVCKKYFSKSWNIIHISPYPIALQINFKNIYISTFKNVCYIFLQIIAI